MPLISSSCLPDPPLTVTGKRGTLNSNSNNSPPRGPRLRRLEETFQREGLLGTECGLARPVIYGNEIMVGRGSFWSDPGEQVPGPPAVPTGCHEASLCSGPGSVRGALLSFITHRRWEGLSARLPWPGQGWGAAFLREPAPLASSGGIREDSVQRESKAGASQCSAEKRGVWRCTIGS